MTMQVTTARCPSSALLKRWCRLMVQNANDILAALKKQAEGG